MIEIASIMILLQHVLTQWGDFKFIKAGSISNLCPEQLEIPGYQYQPSFHQVVLPLTTDDFPSVTFDKGDIGLCNADCLLQDCCTSDECRRTLNSNYDAIEPNTVYYLLHGGYIPQDGQIYKFDAQPSVGYFSDVSSSIFLASSKTGEMFRLELLGLPIVFHRGVIVKRMVNDIELHDYYFFGGYDRSNEENAGAKMWKVNLPTAPKIYSDEKPQLVSLGEPNTEFANVIGHCMTYDEARQRIVVFGGFFNNMVTMEYSNDIWIFDLQSKSWEKVTPEVSRPFSFTVGTQSYNFTYFDYKPLIRTFASCYIEDNKLVIIGGVSQNQTEDTVYSHDVWSFDFETRYWTQLENDYFTFDQSLTFGLDFFPEFMNMNEDDLNSYLLYEQMADFSQFYVSKGKQISGIAMLDAKHALCMWISADKQTYFCSTSSQAPSLCGSINTKFYEKTGFKLTHDCFKNGQCINGVCICDSGFYGPLCQYRDCPNNCSLPQNFTNFISFAEKPQPGFENNSTKCLYTFPESYCACRPDILAAADNCSKLLCMNDCSGDSNGVCDFSTGICTCKENYYGADCSMLNISLDV